MCQGVCVQAQCHRAGVCPEHVHFPLCRAAVSLCHVSAMRLTAFLASVAQGAPNRAGKVVHAALGTRQKQKQSAYLGGGGELCDRDANDAKHVADAEARQGLRDHCVPVASAAAA